MAGLLDRINGQLAQRDDAHSRDGYLTQNDWAELFQFGGIGYPVVQTTMGSVDEERIGISSTAANKGNASVYSLVMARVQAFAQVRFQWTRFQGALQGDLFGSPELSLLENPWPGGSTAQLLAKMEIDNSLAGNAYIVEARPGRLARLRPDFVTIILGSRLDRDFPADAEDVEIAGYAYRPRSGRLVIFTPEQVAHYAPMPDPDFQFLGMSWITPCTREVQADSLATEHKARFFQNAATPNLALKFDPMVGIDMVKQFKALLEEEHRGAFNAYKTLYLGGGADPVVVGKDFQQLDFAVTQGKGESRLAAAAGVPASWVGFSEGLKGSSLNAGNFNAQRRRFSDGTMMHLWTAAAQALANVIGPRRDPVSGKIDTGATLWFDTRVPFMREDAQDQATINFNNAQTIALLVREGFEPDSVVAAVNANDMSRLKHSGLVSVQLQPPGLVASTNGYPSQTYPTPGGNGSAPKALSNGTVSSNN